MWWILLLVPSLGIAQPDQTKITETINNQFDYHTETVGDFPTGEYRIEPEPIKISPSLSEWLTELGNCESGGDYTKNTGNGFYGKYQFMIDTWNRISIRGDVNRPDLYGVRPDMASPKDQDYMIIRNTEITAGLVTQNPGCYIKLGLSNKPPKE